MCCLSENPMLDLVFLTSSTVKIAHVRHIAARLPIRVIGIRQQIHHSSYFEPRVSSRSELLEVSYRSALQQCREVGISTRCHFFMLEDTSVRINALSTPDRDFPGLDIKYWMEGMSFAGIDKTLKEAGNDRSVHMQSDVLLHIPNEYRLMLEVTEDYRIFTGRQDGYIIDEEIEFESKVVSPWTDNRMFNKCFCPHKYKLPLGALDVIDADLVDFRRKAFSAMFAFLYDSSVMEETPVQMRLPLEEDIDLILCGYTCAGKTTASQHLARAYGYLHIEASDFMHLSYYYRHGYRPNISIGDFAEQALTQMPHIVAENVAEYILEEESAPVVISGFRSMEEIDWLRDYLSFTGKKFRIVFIDTDQDLRFSRMRSRNRTGDGVSFEQFRIKDSQQRRMGLGEVRETNGVEIWRNEQSLKSCLDYVDSRIEGRYLEDSITETEKVIRDLKYVKNVKLEDAILVALLSVWTRDETRIYCSTSEIASMINKTIFPSIQPKHRENVHRYFNQDFYAYYEIDSRDRDNVRVYRLSNTGYGRALKSLRNLVLGASGESAIEPMEDRSKGAVELL